MDITCPKCGAANRNTSRFCARCGEVLHAAESTAQNGKGLNLSWLEAVQERAVKQTGDLNAQRLAEAEARRAGRILEAVPDPKTETVPEPKTEPEAKVQAAESDSEVKAAEL